MSRSRASTPRLVARPALRAAGWPIAAALCTVAWGSLALPASTAAQQAPPRQAQSSGAPQAQPQTAPTDAQRARARQLYGEGQAHFDAGRFAEAQAAFEGAYREVPNPVVLLGVASAQERLGHGVDAARTLRQYLRERPDAPDRATIEARIAQLDPRGESASEAAPQTGMLRIVCTPVGAAIAVDGEDTGRTAPADVEVAPGEHTVTLTLEGYQPISETVTVAPGGTNELALTLAASEGATETDTLGEGGEGEGAGEQTIEPPPTTAVDPGPSVGVWVTTAIAGVALVTGTVFGFLALSAQSDFDSNPTADTADRGETFALVADLAFGVAIAAGVTAIVLYATDRPSSEPVADATPPEDDAAGDGADGDVEGGPEGGGGAGETTTSRRRPRRSQEGPRLTVAPWGGPTGAGAAMSVQF